jgi:NADPH2 dehydrogenase
MRMKDPIPQYTHFVRSVRTSHPNLAHLHVLQPDRHTLSPEASNEFLRAIWKPKPLITGGEYTRETAIETAKEHGDLIAFGRLFIGNVRREVYFSYKYS